MVGSVPTTVAPILVGSTKSRLRKRTPRWSSQSMTVADVVAQVRDGRLDDFVREAVALVARELMEAEITGEIGAGRGEVAPEARVTHRNGYRPTDVGDAGSGRSSCWSRGSVPGPAYFPSFLEPGGARSRRSSRSCWRPMSTGSPRGRSTGWWSSWGSTGMTKDRVSAICRGLDEQVELFRTRPLEGAYPYLWLDAKHVKVRDHGRVVSKALVVAYAVHESGVREVIGLDIGEVESGAFWLEFLRVAEAARPARRALGDLRPARRAQAARSPACWAARGSAAPCTSLATWSCTAAATSAASSPPR